MTNSFLETSPNATHTKMENKKKLKPQAAPGGPGSFFGRGRSSAPLRPIGYHGG